ncbi:hypothetical protein [Spongiactinospora sp. TRM90649]|uniref:hypothetical protein n=1 Tax=Spongiactinospora sp. TRM90649 TaxID=3031114 RepID=UPI0023F8AD4E|nr:hypothetical protein [Spongiactinospora sp. TRM90649]MDF5755562.1 hypothetical protein [Spongiactinospora sp. TRM90649]
MSPDKQYEGFDHLVRLTRDLHGLGHSTMLVVPAVGPPILEVVSAAGTSVRIAAVNRRCGWVFTWRPWWALRWPRNRWVIAHADNAAALIMTRVRL